MSSSIDSLYTPKGDLLDKDILAFLAEKLNGIRGAGAYGQFARNGERDDGSLEWCDIRKRLYPLMP